MEANTINTNSIVIEPSTSATQNNTRGSIVVRGKPIDSDVLAEKEHVKNIYNSHVISKDTNTIFIHDLKKVYYGKGSTPTKVAVNHVSVSIGKGTIFGLLGANGAGKTSLLKIVSGLEEATQGEAYINGFDLTINKSKAQRSMGLCPQFDTLIERLSVRENILFFGQVKGLPTEHLNEICETFMEAMKIKRYEHKMIMHLSGGNRRKVSLCIALIGCPPTVYLDEPSTGLDPVASRLMWKLLIEFMKSKQIAMVLTTHNMLECEAVCSRIGIMKCGELVCMGDSQHLRSVHGTGFLLEMSLKDSSYVDGAKNFITTHFFNAVIIDEHSTMINYEISKEAVGNLSNAFKLLEENKQALGVMDYSLSQSTLEQVFLKQIKPTEQELLAQLQSESNTRKPKFMDYFIIVVCMLLAVIFPGLHHFYLRNYTRAFLYLITWNECACGLILDFYDLPVLVQRSVLEYGHIEFCPWCCCGCCCCGKKKRIASEE